LAEDDWRRKAPPFQEPKLSQNLALVEALEPIAATLATTVASLALAWVLAVPGVTGVIVGGRRPAQLDDWLGADRLGLDAETLAEIEAAVEATGAGTDESQQPPPVAVAPDPV
jgi:aryl-alcohol dehydrogenase-like predicted oxidoreductase